MFVKVVLPYSIKFNFIIIFYFLFFCFKTTIGTYGFSFKFRTMLVALNLKPQLLIVVLKTTVSNCDFKFKAKTKIINCIFYTKKKKKSCEWTCDYKDYIGEYFGRGSISIIFFFKNDLVTRCFKWASPWVYIEPRKLLKTHGAIYTKPLEGRVWKVLEMPREVHTSLHYGGRHERSPRLSRKF